MMKWLNLDVHRVWKDPVMGVSGSFEEVKLDSGCI